jgi:hypothetical protein
MKPRAGDDMTVATRILRKQRRALKNNNNRSVPTGSGFFMQSSDAAPDSFWPNDCQPE